MGSEIDNLEVELGNRCTLIPNDSGSGLGNRGFLASFASGSNNVMAGSNYIRHNKHTQTRGLMACYSRFHESCSFSVYSCNENFLSVSTPVAEGTVFRKHTVHTPLPPTNGD